MMPEAPRSVPPRVALLVATSIVLAMIFLVGPTLRPGAPAVAGPAQQTYTYHLPDVQTRGAALGLEATGEGPLGMVGFGNSTIELINRGDKSLDARIELVNFDQDRRFQQALGPRRAQRIPLQSRSGFGLGDYHGRVTAQDHLGVQVRSEWPEGGSGFTYGAPESGSDLILPLAARGVYSFTSNIHILDASGSSAENEVEINFFDRQGGLQKSLGLRLGEGEAAEYDLLFDAQFGDLPQNSVDGYLNAIHFSADEPVAVLALGDEISGIGTSSLRARPAGRANSTQYLPLVRANYLGDSLIGIANRENSAVQVTLRYLGAADSPAGAGQSFEQQLSIEARSAAFIDLSNRGRGNAVGSGPPRGSGINQGFYGSLSIEASGRVLAAVVEQAHEGTTVRSNAAYNAFGPDDLALAWAAPVEGHGSEGRRQSLLVYNPNPDPVGIDYALLAGSGRSSEVSHNLDGGGLMVIPVQVPGGSQADQALVEATDLVAVLDYETSLTGLASWGSWGADALAEWAVPVPGGGGESPPTYTPSVTPDPPTATPTPTVEPGTTPATDTPSPEPTGGTGDLFIYLPRCTLNQ